MLTPKADRQSIIHFVRFLDALGYGVPKIDHWPEDTGEDAQPDAIAGQYVIEHTSIDVLPNQRRNDAWFTTVIEGLTDECEPALDGRLVIWFPFDAVAPGQDWDQMRHALRVWVSSEANLLKDGPHESVSVPGIPFPLRMVKGGEFGGRKLMFGRHVTEDNQFPERLSTQAKRKLKKLSAHRTAGKRTILLFESTDRALMSHARVLEAIEVIFPVWPSELDEAWFAHVLGSDLTSYCNLRTSEFHTFNIATHSVIPKAMSGWD